MISAYKHVFATDGNISEPLSIEIIDGMRSKIKGWKSYGNPELKKIGLNTLYTEDVRRPSNAYAPFRSFSIPLGHNNETINRVEKEGKELREDLLKEGSLTDGVNQETPYDVVPHSECGVVRAASGSARTYYEAVISRYNKEIETIGDSTPNEQPNPKKLDSIIKLARDLERIHPYADFNCRTFCVLVLNRELVKNGFSPSLMEDPNVFDYQSLAELKKSVGEGQRNFEHLREHGVAHDQDPTNEEWKTYSTKTTIKQLETDEKEAREVIEDDEILERPRSIEPSDSSERSEVSSQRSEKSDTTKRSSSDKTATSSQNRLDQPLSLGKAAASPKGENDTPKAKQKIQQPSVDLGKPQIIFGEGMLEASISQQHSDVGTSRSSQSRLKTSLSLAKATMSLPTSQSSVVPQGRLRPQHSSLSRDSKSGNSASNFRTAQVMQRLGRNKGSSRQKTQISRPQIRPSEGPVNKGLGLLYMIDSPLPERMSPVAAVYGIPEGDLVISRVLAPKPPTTKVSSAVVAGAIKHTLTRNSQKSFGSSSTKMLQPGPRKRMPQEGIERT